MRTLLVLTLLAGCTDRSWASFEALGNPAHVRCFSGGQLIYDGKSTGKVGHPEGSDGWEFKEAGSGNFVRVSGDCIVRN